ncbi:MAG: TonB-dependent receptor [Bacteroidota bacterium]
MKKILYVTLLLFLGQSLMAQTLKGKITDKYHDPISDVYVYTPSGEKHSHSNALGQFEMPKVAVGDTLIISFLGFETQEKVVQQADFNQEMKVVLKEEIIDLKQVNVSNSLKAINTLTSIDLRVTPVNSSQEILRRVPGLFIGQHAGGGKAEQIFLRGFDIDHGTDVSITVDGMPVNMVSHAHGQGYADLHFLIPETIENIDFGKGPYYTDQGNFTTAGYIDFKTKEKLDKSTFGVEFGQFNTFRTVGLFDLLGNQKKQNAYVATEYLMSDGPFESPQNFKRLNIMGKYNADLDNGDRLSMQVSRFQSKWDASGQIPQRAVDDGTITRFGAIDDTEGGSTSRTNVAINHTKTVNSNTFLKTNAFFSHYDFELFSNFTFFLEDPDNADQIRQAEDRRIYGVNSSLFHNLSLDIGDLELSTGLGLRYDDVDDVILERTANRKTSLEQLALGDVNETNVKGFVDAQLDLGKWMFNAGLRLDVFSYDYIDRLAVAYTSLSDDKAILSPKFNIIYNPNNQWQVFLKAGKGFHSNDTRVVVQRSTENILPAAYGADFGAVWKPAPRLWVTPAVWYLFLEQEFVYVGDAAVVEPSGKTVRQGVDLSLRFQLNDYLFLDGDVNYTNARATEEDEGADRIPLAPELTSIGGLTFRHPGGFTGSIRYRYIRDRPANEDNSIIAEGYFITDLNASYAFKNLTIGFNIENLFNQEWNEAQFATESRLKGELNPVEELHFTPGVPFFFKGSVRYNF